jgi:hypothetical protein
MAPVTERSGQKSWVPCMCSALVRPGWATRSHMRCPEKQPQ